MSDVLVFRGVRAIDPAVALDAEVDVVVERGRIARLGPGVGAEAAGSERARVVELPGALEHGADLGAQAIFAARGFDGYPEQVKFAAPELLAPTGPNSDATVAFDPDSDRAVAAWRTGAGALAYAVRAPGAP